MHQPKHEEATIFSADGSRDEYVPPVVEVLQLEEVVRGAGDGSGDIAGLPGGFG